MALRFTERLKLDSHSTLSNVQRAQLDVIGPRYFGGVGAAQLAAPGSDPDDDPMETRTLGFCEVAGVVDGERRCFDAWFYMVDSGTIFTAGTADIVAEVVQFGLECGDPALRAELGPAMVEAKLLPPGDGSYDEFSRLLAARP
jgi:hypothetical protein